MRSSYHGPKDCAESSNECVAQSELWGYNSTMATTTTTKRTAKALPKTCTVEVVYAVDHPELQASYDYKRKRGARYIHRVTTTHRDAMAYREQCLNGEHDFDSAYVAKVTVVKAEHDGRIKWVRKPVERTRGWRLIKCPVNRPEYAVAGVL